MHSSPDVVLIYPPHASVTQPYLSLPSLTAYLRGAGFRVYQYDASIEAFDLLLHPSNIAACLGKIAESLTKNGRRRWPRKKRSRLALAQACGDFVLEHIEESKAFFRAIDTFYDAGDYTRAHNTFKRAMDIISAAYYPLDMKSNELSFYRITSWPNLHRLTGDESMNPFLRIIRDIIVPKLPDNAPVYGISVTYHSQLVPAFTFARWIKRTRPDAKIILGGAYLTDRRRGIISHELAFRNVDAYVFGEGETPLLKLVELAVAGKPFPLEMRSVHLPKDGKKIEDFDLSLLNSEDFDSLPTPDYEGLDFTRYFSPKPVFLLSNARGCYWRKCAFCAVSCATGKTFRQRSIEKIKADINTLIDRHGAQYVFFSDDCIPPKRLQEIASHCLRNKRQLYWQTEARYDRKLTPSLLRFMFDGGCRQLTFGNESGNQRVLDAMRKGTVVEENEHIIKDANSAGIAVQLQNFIGFPSETKEEATQTIDQLVRLRNHIAGVAIGTFNLREDSLCGRKPEKYGISNVRVKRPKNIHSTFLYDVKQGMSQQETGEVFNQFHSRLMRAFPYNDFFFDGSVGVHAMIYLGRQKQSKPHVFPFSRRDSRVDKLVATRPRMNGDELNCLLGYECDHAIIFHKRTGEAIHIKTEYIEVVSGLNGTCSALEAVVKKSLNGGQLDDTKAAELLVIMHDLLRKEVIKSC